MSSPSISGSSGNQSSASTPINSAPASPANRRHCAQSLDTKSRLFGAIDQSPRRIVKNTMKSTIFDDVCQTQKQLAHKKPIPSIRRNPITGEVYDDTFSGGADKMNGNMNGSLSLPSTPVKIRHIPNGKISNLFY